ncbi:MAG: SRPBCC domain-containing protein, partial [Bacteroidota bacterium]
NDCFNRKEYFVRHAIKRQTAMKIPSIKMSVAIHASPTELFVALVETKKVIKWSGQKGKVEPNVGGKFEFFDGWVKGNVLAYEVGKTLAYTWLPVDWPEGIKPSIVRYKFTATKKGTRVTMTHSGFPSRKEMLGHKAGWTEHFFDPLRSYFNEKQ